MSTRCYYQFDIGSLSPSTKHGAEALYSSRNIPYTIMADEAG